MIKIFKNKTYQVFGVLIALVLLCRKPKDDISKTIDISDNYEPKLGTRVSKIKNGKVINEKKPINTEVNIKPSSSYLQVKKVKPFLSNQSSLKGKIQHGSNTHIKPDLSHLKKPFRHSSSIRKDINVSTKFTLPKENSIRPTRVKPEVKFNKAF